MGSGFKDPYGACSDKDGNAYVADFGSGTITMFKYGGTKGKIVAKGLKEPIGCSVNENGDLAVSQKVRSGSPGQRICRHLQSRFQGRREILIEQYLAWPPSISTTKNRLFVEGELWIVRQRRILCFGTSCQRYVVHDGHAQRRDNRQSGFGRTQPGQSLSLAIRITMVSTRPPSTRQTARDRHAPSRRQLT